MVLRTLRGWLAKARSPDKQFAIISYDSLPELYTLLAAPDQVHAEGVKVSHNLLERTLAVHMQGKTTVFALREDHVLVFSDTPFSVQQFRSELKAAAMRQRANTKSAQSHYQERVSKTAP